MDMQLDQQYCTVLDQVLQSCPQALEIIDKCKKIGWPVEEFEQQVRAQQAMAQRAKAELFPHNP